MKKSNTNLKIYIFSNIIIIIPFLEFINSNINNIDKTILNQLIIFYFLVFFFFTLLNFIFFKFFKNKSHIYILSFSFFYWSLFRFKSIKDFFGGDDFRLSAEISFVVLFIFLGLFWILLNKEKLYKKSTQFLFLFIVAQNVFLSSFILFNYLKFLDPNEFKNNNYLSYIYKERKYFSKDELIYIKKNQNKNIYFFVFDGMTSLDEYKKYISNKTIDIGKIKKFFIEKNYVYIDNSYSNYDFTTASFGSMLQMLPLYTQGLTRSNKLYKDQLYPNVLSKLTFDNNKHPNLIYNLYKLNYNFIWLGNSVGCEIYNPPTCINYASLNKVSSFFNWYILQSFFANTPLNQIYNIALTNLFKQKTIDHVSKNNDNFDFTEDFLKNHHSQKNSNKKNYFYLIHNLFPKGSFAYDDNCETSLRTNVKLNLYLNNYNCALNIIKKIIVFLENKDPEALVIFQSDHGVIYEKKTENTDHEYDKKKIFNLIKVPKKCREMLNNNLDNINTVRLALSCATNTKPKLLERKNLQPL